MTDKKLSQLPAGTTIQTTDLFYSAHDAGGGSFTSVYQPWSAILAALPTGSGNVSNSGTPTVNQYARWVDATHIEGVSTATVLTDIGAQPLDADLTSLASASATGAIYYRSAANTWTTVTIGGNLSFSGGTLNTALNPQPLDPELSAIAGLTSAADQVPMFTGSGAASLITVTGAARTVLDDTTVGAMLTTLGGQPLDSDLTSWAAITRASGFDTFTTTPSSANLATLVTDETGTGALVFANSPVLAGNPTAPTPAAGDNDTSIATTAFVQSTLTAYADPQRAISGAAGTISTLATDVVITVNWTSGASGSYTLPVANTRAGLPIMIKDVGGTFGSRPLTINRGGSDTIDGQTSIVLNVAFQYIKLRPLAAGGAWFIER